MGDQLAQRLETFANNDSIVMCLDRSALLCCIELAAMLHAWVFMIHSETIDDPYAIDRKLGVVLESGEFVLNPAISTREYDYIYTNFSSEIDQAKRVAMSRLNRGAQVNAFDYSFINGRNVLLADDIFRDDMGLAIAKAILKPLRPNHVEGVAGNILPDISTKLYLETEGTTYLDVIPSNLFDDDHYFEQPDSYSDEQKADLAKNISIYWA